MDNLLEQLSKTSNSTDCEDEFLRKRVFWSCKAGRIGGKWTSVCFIGGGQASAGSRLLRVVRTMLAQTIWISFQYMLFVLRDRDQYWPFYFISSRVYFVSVEFKDSSYCYTWHSAHHLSLSSPGEELSSQTLVLASSEPVSSDSPR